MYFCKYKDIFGKIGEGIHSIRIYNIAIFDVILTIISAIIIHKIVPLFNIYTTVFLLFILGIIMHRLFCVRTTIDKFLFK